MENLSQSEGLSFPRSEMLHALSNKLLPIIVFSELGLRRSQDSQLSEHFRKILHSVREAQLLLDQLRFENEPEDQTPPAPNLSLEPEQNRPV